MVLPTLYAMTGHLRPAGRSSIEVLGHAGDQAAPWPRLTLDSGEVRYFSFSGHDDVAGVLANMGITRPSRWQPYLTLATTVTVLKALTISRPNNEPLALTFPVLSLGYPLAYGRSSPILSTILESSKYRSVPTGSLARNSFHSGASGWTDDGDTSAIRLSAWIAQYWPNG